MKRTVHPRTLVLAALGIASPAFATEGGGTVVPIGVQTIASGSLQSPGDYLLNYNLWNTADDFAGPGGKNTRQHSVELYLRER